MRDPCQPATCNRATCGEPVSWCRHGQNRRVASTGARGHLLHRYPGELSLLPHPRAMSSGGWRRTRFATSWTAKRSERFRRRGSAATESAGEPSGARQRAQPRQDLTHFARPQYAVHGRHLRGSVGEHVPDVATQHLGILLREVRSRRSFRPRGLGRDLRWLSGFERASRRVYVVHGESAAARSLPPAIHARFGRNTSVAEEGATVPIER
jgi:hypothetical protein